MTVMFRALVLVSLLGLGLAHRERRFIFNPGGQNPQSPFGGRGGMGSPYGGGNTENGYTPCTPSQAFCNLQCDNGYVKGPTGCDFCLCSTNSKSVTTVGPVLIDPIDSKVSAPTSTQLPAVATQVPSQVLSQTTTATDCVAAQQKCKTSCGDKGYLVDPSDCTFCLCKNFML